MNTNGSGHEIGIYSLYFINVNSPTTYLLHALSE